MASGIKDKVAILGMGCTRFGERWDAGPEDLMVEAFAECIADAGIEREVEVFAARPQIDDPHRRVARSDDEIVAAARRRVGQIAEQVAAGKLSGDRDLLADEATRIENQIPDRRRQRRDSC